MCPASELEADKKFGIEMRRILRLVKFCFKYFMLPMFCVILPLLYFQEMIYTTEEIFKLLASIACVELPEINAWFYIAVLYLIVEPVYEYLVFTIIGSLHVLVVLAVVMFWYFHYMINKKIDFQDS